MEGLWREETVQGRFIFPAGRTSSEFSFVSSFYRRDNNKNITGRYENTGLSQKIGPLTFQIYIFFNSWRPSKNNWDFDNLLNSYHIPLDAIIVVSQVRYQTITFIFSINMPVLVSFLWLWQIYLPKATLGGKGPFNFQFMVQHRKNQVRNSSTECEFTSQSKKLGGNHEGCCLQAGREVNA